jgi:hypothetical protein
MQMFLVGYHQHALQCRRPPQHVLKTYVENAKPFFQELRFFFTSMLISSTDITLGVQRAEKWCLFERHVEVVRSISEPKCNNFTCIRHIDQMFFRK